MNYLDEKELITHCIKCDTALEESESMTCTACNKETEYEHYALDNPLESGSPFEEECKCCGITAPDVVLGLCDACDSKYGE